MLSTFYTSIYSGDEVDRYSEADLVQVQKERGLRIQQFIHLRAPSVLIENAQRLFLDGEMRLAAYRRAKYHQN